MKFPMKIKKDIGLFLTSEEAKVLKKDIAKLGLSAAAIAVIMAQAMDSGAAEHVDSHGDSSTHGDHTSHTDGASHTDGHGNHDDHTNVHTDNPMGKHYSTAADYDTANRRGGHNSYMGHDSSHTNG